MKDNQQKFFREIQVEFLIHELKDPIAVIETGVRSLLEKREKYGALTSRQEKTLKRTLRNTQKAREMLYNLLEIGRSESNCFHCSFFQPTEVLYSVLADSLETMNGNIFEQFTRFEDKDQGTDFLSDCGICMDIDPCTADIRMFQDEIKFRHITGNLIRNAFHHRKKKVEIKTKTDKNNLLVEIIDDGPGIAPEHHEMVFQRYIQVKEEKCSALQRKGHGLGLAGSLIIARRLGGNIELESKKGKGATFRLILPIKLENMDET